MVIRHSFLGNPFLNHQDTPPAPEIRVDRNWMRLALQLAFRGQGHVEPNPMVGCVIVVPSDDPTKAGRLIGQGWHRRYGQSHAEVEAIADVHRNGYSDLLEQATAYVTLEPCCHQGKTPPCTSALIQANLQRVVIAVEDPFESVSGQGILTLQKAGIRVDVGVLEAEAADLNGPFFKAQKKGMPWVIAKWAMTLDGKLATSAGDSKWISNEACRELVHQLRGRVDGVMVGSGTALADDPGLTARPKDRKSIRRIATRIVIDQQLKLELTSQLVKTANETPVVVFCGSLDGELVEKASQFEQAGVQVVGFESKTADGPNVWTNLPSVLEQLGEMGMQNILLEGGGSALGSFFDQDLIDEVHVFVAPVIAGSKSAVTPVGGTGVQKMVEALRLRDQRSEMVGDNWYVSGRVQR